MRPGIKKEDILKLTGEEKLQIEAQRKFNLVDKGTRSYDVLAKIDRIARQVWENKNKVDKTLIELMNFNATMNRDATELESGNITRELKPGLPMSQDELQWNIRLTKNMAETAVFNLPLILADLREVVGYKDVKGDVVISEEEYESYVDYVENEVKKLGYELF